MLGSRVLGKRAELPTAPCIFQRGWGQVRPRGFIAGPLRSRQSSGRSRPTRSGQTPQRRKVPCHAVLNGPSVVPSGALEQEDSTVRTGERVKKLETLVELRRLYRNFLRAEALLSTSSPIYQPPQGEVNLDSNPEAEAEEEARVMAALEVVADLQLTTEQIKASLRALPQGFGSRVFSRGSEVEAEEQVRTIALDYSNKLRARYGEELPCLPFPSEYTAQAAVDQLIQKYRGAQRGSSAAAQQDDTPGSEIGGSEVKRGPMERFEEAEKVAEKFVTRRLRPALRKAQESDLVDLLKGSGAYLKGLWVRLNGGGAKGPRQLPSSLPLPVSTKKQGEVVISALGLELESLEKKVQEASKARETKLRKTGIQGRVQLAIQLKLLDTEVFSLSRLLAVKTLQLEMEYIYRALEDEVLDIGSDLNRATMTLRRQGTSDELALLVAEFGLLEEQLAILSGALQAASGQLVLVGDDLLEMLAVEIPDMRMRVGVGDQEVFGSNPFSLTRLQLQATDSLDKLMEGVNFMTRGVRLLLSDVANMGQLFTKAALGGTLKSREVVALRRTARDLLTFIPFTIILIIPLTPLGHVLVFGFIQRYFPGFFPSQFTMRRQDIMMRYENLRHQLLEAQSRAEAEEEEEELARAAEAVARLTAPTASADGGEGSSMGPTVHSRLSSGNSDSPTGRAAEQVVRLQRELDAMRDITQGLEDDQQMSPGSEVSEAREERGQWLGRRRARPADAT